MNTSIIGSTDCGSYQLRFRSLFPQGCAYAVPCDCNGQVDLDAMSDRARLDYLYARTVIGREFAAPAVMLGE